MAQWKVHVFAIQAALDVLFVAVALGKCLRLSASPLLKGDGSQARGTLLLVGGEGGDVWKCLETFSVVTARGLLVDRSQGCL